ncbi:hypothetical protein [Brevundimonas denitrificans]|uniref:hypothetical protein n=1 Tax=Brevundimonas denitrificans TaxID=1443434 RepID=UPI00223C482E|nr:hypothetical protein [Brevundimonas denitrificans]
MLDWLGPDRFLSPQDWTERALAGRLGPDDLCLTFDDALLCQSEIAAPVLKAYGLTGFWFVYSSVLEGRSERLELYRHFRSTRFGDVDEFYAAFQARLERSDHGAEARAALSDSRRSAIWRSSTSTPTPTGGSASCAIGCWDRRATKR